MSKKVHFVSGLPRACSTLLCNVLAQNPKVYATPTSPVHEIGYIARQVFGTEEAKAVGGDRMQSMYYDYVRAGVEGAYDSLTDRPVVADKCRSWVAYLDQLFAIWPEAKVLVPVRDVRGILCSFEKKRRAHPSTMIAGEGNPMAVTTIDKRCQSLLSGPPLGIALERLHEANTRFGDRLHFVHAEDLTEDLQGTMDKVWDYLGEERVEHNAFNVEQFTDEVDVGFPYGDHTIRNKVEPLPREWNEILGRELSEVIKQKFDWINKL